MGLYSHLADSAFTTEPLLRVARTDSRGRFIIRGVAPGTYRCYALNDMDGDYRYSQNSEMLAFSSRLIEPSCRPDVRQDTIWRDSLRIDNITRIPYTHFLPDDIVLCAFTLPQTDRHFLKYERQDEHKFTLFFTYGDSELPRLKGLNFDAEEAFLIEPSTHNDTIIYWLRDTSLVNMDTLQVEMTYHDTDTLGQLAEKVDTLELLAKTPFAKREKERMKELEKWKKKVEKALKKGEPIDTVMPVKPLELKVLSSSSLDPDKNVLIEVPTPLIHCDTAAIHLYVKHDTLWYNARWEWELVEGCQRRYQLLAEWRPGLEYSMEIDSAAFVDIYGKVSAPMKQGIRVKTLDEYSTLTIEVTSPDSIADSTLVVQLLNSSDTPVKSARVTDGVAEFFYLNPQTYYMRAYADLNGNGKWDVGDYASGLQPEPVFYHPRSVECKAKWDITRSWVLMERPLPQQKPTAITKQKADREKKRRNRNADRAAKMGIQPPVSTVK